jgi:predicted O-methyltransferase YrrM
MNDYLYKLEQFLIEDLKKIENINILEFGVRKGVSTKLFLEIVKLKNGRLYSVDIEDCSNLFNDKNWKFFKTRDDNFEYIKKNIPEQLDVIYLDSVHEAKHVEKIFYNYYNFLKVGGYFIIDDISHLPYLKNNLRNNFFNEINNQETFKKILDIYNSNYNNFDLIFSFISSGMAKIIKKKDSPLNINKKIISRENSIKNFLRLILKNL